MLFTGTTAKPKRDEKKEKKSDRDEKYDIQESVFVRWGNSLLANEPLKDFRDLSDLKYINSIANIATGINSNLTGNRYEDCCTLLNNVNDMKTSPQELAESQQKAVLAMWWDLVQTFWKRFGPDPIREEKLSEAIKQWCLEVTKDYEAVSVCDFTSSWRDGYALNCLLHSFDSKLVDLSVIAESTATDRIEYAFATAEKRFKVARLLNVKGTCACFVDVDVPWM
ncbi:hypothetical protein NECAME_14324 [Necator americanus]|uniref:Calponin-homology (CH) domain-containing protein n=1 Tax=Necator americanus TaxID=51031 RepID=W2SQF1_NECAM|nr:hypothetical protein NECAME_14324 [Necator americanus]ETN71106.1 hypothetical protein NECAME_14324 [Necator americanus]